MLPIHDYNYKGQILQNVGTVNKHLVALLYLLWYCFHGLLYRSCSGWIKILYETLQLEVLMVLLWCSLWWGILLWKSSLLFSNKYFRRRILFSSFFLILFTILSALFFKGWSFHWKTSHWLLTVLTETVEIILNS